MRRTRGREPGAWERVGILARDGAIVDLVLLPSLVLFFIGWEPLCDEHIPLGSALFSDFVVHGVAEIFTICLPSLSPGMPLLSLRSVLSPA